MKDIMTVSKFTMKEMLRRKSFIVTTIILMIVIVIGFNVPKIIKIFSGDGEGMLQGEKVIISDSENIYEGKLNELSQQELEYKIEITPSTFDEIKTKINNKEVKAGVIIQKQDDKVLFRYIVNDTMATMPENLSEALQKLYTNNQIEKLGLTEQKIKEIMPEFEMNTEQTEEVKGNSWMIMIISILLFYAIYFCAYQVSSSITTEKTSKIMETLVTSTSPRTIVIGKTLGIGIGGLIQMLLLALTAVVSAKLFLDPILLEFLLSSTQITPIVGVLMVVFFILGYFLFATLFALTGSTVSKPEDIQSANTPVLLLTIAGFYIAQSALSTPVGTMATFATYFPLSSPFLMPFRVMMGVSSMQEVILSLVILIVSMLIIAHIAIKIYSNAILNYGTKLSIKNLIKMYKTK